VGGGIGKRGEKKATPPRTSFLEGISGREKRSRTTTEGSKPGAIGRGDGRKKRGEAKGKEFGGVAESKKKSMKVGIVSSESWVRGEQSAGKF